MEGFPAGYPISAQDYVDVNIDLSEILTSGQVRLPKAENVAAEVRYKCALLSRQLGINRNLMILSGTGSLVFAQVAVTTPGAIIDMPQTY